LIQLHEEFFQTDKDITNELKSIFLEELNPVAKISQESVPVPEGLDLDKWINEEENFQKEKDEDFGYQNNEEETELSTNKHKILGTKDDFNLSKTKYNKEIPTKNLKDLLGKETPAKIKIKKKEKIEDEKVEIKKDEEMPENAIIKKNIEINNDKKTKLDKKSKNLGNVDLTGIENEEIFTVKEYKKQTKEDIIKKEKIKEREDLKIDKKLKKKIPKKRLCIDQNIKVVNLFLN
jgi:hypothetical protein